MSAYRKDKSLWWNLTYAAENVNRYSGGGALVGAVAGGLMGGPIGLAIGTAIGMYVGGKYVPEAIEAGSVQVLLPPVTTAGTTPATPNVTATIKKGGKAKIIDPLGGAVNAMQSPLSTSVVSGVGIVEASTVGTQAVTVSWWDQFGNPQTTIVSLTVQ